MTVISQLVLYISNNQKKDFLRTLGVEPRKFDSGIRFDKPEFFHYAILQAKTMNNSFKSRKAHKFSKLSLTLVSFHITDQSDQFTCRNIVE